MEEKAKTTELMARIETAGVPSATAASSNNLIGMRAIVTGANSGIGFCTARELVRRGANVTLACRSLNKGQEAADAINALDPFGEASCMELDLADLHSVKNFASAYLHQHDTCNILVNNAVCLQPLRCGACGSRKNIKV